MELTFVLTDDCRDSYLKIRPIPLDEETGQPLHTPEQWIWVDTRKNWFMRMLEAGKRSELEDQLIIDQNAVTKKEGT